MSFLFNRCGMSAWYCGKGITIVIVSKDERDLDKGKWEGVTGWNSTPSVLKIGERDSLEISKHYVSGMKNSSELRDRISAALEQQGAKVAKGDNLYPEDNDNERRALIDEAKVSQEAIGEGNPHSTGWVVGVIKRKWRYYVGHLDLSSALSVGGRSQRNVFLIPMEKKIPKIRFRIRQASELFGKRIGGVQYWPSPKAMLDWLLKEMHEWRVPPDPEDPRLQQRVDYRGLLVCSIDPPDSQDIDDVLHASRMPNSKYEVNVHIADVTHSVKPNTSMDDEASVRATIVQLVDKRVDMLPMILSTDLCSLKTHVERFAVSVIWEMTENGDVVDS
ncbi:hypothetical protein HOY82DRAFT_631062 [Tuber indicum]|nr:hypothetical protein HOY82DRAFT_631062 [Tuber indicum]